MRFNELLGRRPQDLSLDPAELAALIDPADSPGITPIVHACLDGQLAKGSCEFRLAGRTIWISATGHVVERDKAGRALRAVGTVEDVTERRKAQDELQAHRDHLEALVHARTRDLALALDAAQGVNRTRSQLLSNVSHELRTPLNHIVGIGQLLQLEMPTDRSRGLLDQLLGSALMLAKLIGNLLDTAKLESDTLQLRDIEFSLTCLLDDVAAELRPQWEKRGHELIRDVDREIADPLRGDPLRLQQVLVELLDNAAKFSERGPVRLRVRQMQLRAAHADLRFEISDRGPGLSDEVQRQMFQLFWQGDPAATRKHGGMGLGLALTQRLVGLMAGRVGGGPTASGGSMFWIELPFALGPPGKAHADGQDMPPPAARAIADQLLQLIDESHPRARLRWADVAEQIGPLLGDRRTSFETALESADFSAASTILRAAMSAHA
jgi:signal transduction histidine kinase